MMDGLFSLLLFAVIFYFMMRHGCGSHASHGHGAGHGQHKPESSNDQHVDPVCGQKVNIDEGYGKMHQGHLYRFCSRTCLDKFESHPDGYIKHPKTAEEEPS